MVFGNSSFFLRRQQKVDKIYQISFDFYQRQETKWRFFQTFFGLLGKDELYKACFVFIIEFNTKFYPTALPHRI